MASCGGFRQILLVSIVRARMFCRAITVPQPMNVWAPATARILPTHGQDTPPRLCPPSLVCAARHIGLLYRRPPHSALRSPLLLAPPTPPPLLDVSAIFSTTPNNVCFCQMVSWLCNLEVSEELVNRLETLADRHVGYGCLPFHCKLRHNCIVTI